MFDAQLCLASYVFLAQLCLHERICIVSNLKFISMTIFLLSVKKVEHEKKLDYLGARSSTYQIHMGEEFNMFLIMLLKPKFDGLR